MAEVEIPFTKGTGDWSTKEGLYSSTQHAVRHLAARHPNAQKIVVTLSDERMPDAVLGLGFSHRNGVMSAFEVYSGDGESWYGPHQVEI